MNRITMTLKERIINLFKDQLGLSDREIFLLLLKWM